MSVTINWNAANNAVSYNVYQSTSGFTNATLPANPVKVLAPATTLEVTAVTPNTIYYFMVSSVGSDGSETLGQVFTVGYFSDTGPGPQTLLRGDWEFGYFGMIPVTGLFTLPEIKSYFPNIASGWNMGVISSYHKVVCNKRILFIPNTPTINTVFSGSTNVVNTLATLGIAPTIANSQIMSKNGYDFAYRLPNTSLSDANYLALKPLDLTSLDFIKSEAGLFLGLFTDSLRFGLTAQNPQGQTRTWNKLLDFVSSNQIVGISPTGVNTLFGVINTTGGLTSIASGVLNIVPVLELLF